MPGNGKVGRKTMKKHVFELFENFVSDFLACRWRISHAAQGSGARGSLELSCVQRWVKTAKRVPSYDQKTEIVNDQKS